MKAKTRSSFKKRFRMTRTGKIKMMKSGRRHLLQQKSKAQKMLGKAKALDVADQFYDVIRRGMPNG